MEKTSRDALPASIETISIVSNEDPSKSVELAGKGLASFYYHESILEDTVKADLSYVDTGNVENIGKNVLEGLPIVGTEKVTIKFTDNSGVKIGASPKLELYVNSVNPVYDDTRKGVVGLSLVSKEFILNEKIRLRQRYDGPISDNVKKILTDQLPEGLATQKDVSDFDDTQGDYSFIGNNLKSLYTINWLSKKSVSSKQSKGSSAGYFFYETSQGYHFKSIDSLQGQEPKKKIVYNEVTDQSSNGGGEDYDYKALEYSKDNLVQAQNKFRFGAYSTRLVCFDPFNCEYQVIESSAEENERLDKLTLGGKKLPKLNEEFRVTGDKKDFTRTTYALLDTGTLPTGDVEEQVEKSNEENFDLRNVLNQSIMRYNQFLAFSASITIPGDFSLHAGDAITLDVPLLQQGDTRDVSARDSGLYIITDLTHFISGSDTLTKLSLVRDSTGKKRQG